MTSVLQNFAKSCGAVLERFRRDDRASLSVEAVLVMPFLIWAFMAIYSFFDVYREKTLSLKGNYAISDLMSRESRVLDMSYLNGVKDVYKYLTKAGDSAWVRVTVVQCTADCDTNHRELSLDWSKATDDVTPYTEASMRTHLEPIIPMLGTFAHLVIVETNMHYTPPFPPSWTGIVSRNFTDIVMTEPRFEAQLCWDGINC